MDRRNFIKITGGGIIVSAAALGGGFALTRTPAQAIEPWTLAGGYTNPRKRALSHASLAPNPHNRQPWEVDLATPERVHLYRDKTKDLPHTDPFDRQLTIGMGCFLELMTIAAAEEGYECRVTYFPHGEDGPVADILFVEGSTEPDPLFHAILERRSCKEPFSDRPLTPRDVETLGSFGDVIADADRVAPLRDLTVKAWEVEYLTPRTLQESIDLMRIGKAEINANPDGIDIGGALMESLNLAGLITREKMMDPTSTAFAQGWDLYQAMLSATPGYVMLKTRGNTRQDQIDAGRRWARLNLTTTQNGLSLHPVSQALQEYPEMKPHYEKIHQDYAQSGETIQMLGRVGYGPSVPPSPRWTIDRKIRS
ncbi:MAG: hypothetical protein V6Z81_09120 [Parvularculales bacterium]